MRKIDPQIKGALIGLAVAVIGGITILTPLYVAYLAATVKANTDRLDRQAEAFKKQAEALNSLANGGGDAKTDARLQQHGLIPPPSIGVSKPHPWKDAVEPAGGTPDGHTDTPGTVGYRLGG